MESEKCKFTHWMVKSGKVNPRKDKDGCPETGLKVFEERGRITNGLTFGRGKGEEGAIPEWMC